MFEIWRFKSDALTQLRGHRMLPALIIFFVLAVQFFLPLPKIVDVEESMNWLWSTSPDLSQLKNFFRSHLNTPLYIRMGVKLISHIILGVIQLGVFRFFLFFSMNSRKTTFAVFLEGLSYWWKSLLASIYVNFRLILWGLLCVPVGILLVLLEQLAGESVAFALLPGLFTLLIVIVLWKNIQYSLLFFILSEYPQVGVRKALKTSVLITRNYCVKIALFFLSFIGWFFLGTFTFGIGFLFVFPYLYTAQANMYKFLNHMAFTNGLLVKKEARHES